MEQQRLWRSVRAQTGFGELKIMKFFDFFVACMETLQLLEVCGKMWIALSLNWVDRGLLVTQAFGSGLRRIPMPRTKLMPDALLASLVDMSMTSTEQVTCPTKNG